MKLAFREIPASKGQLHCRRTRARHCGFSFTEIMFAIVILGIGFIMVAAIFPVSLQQAKLSTEEVTAAPAARGAISTMGKVLKDGGKAVPSSYAPATGIITPDTAKNTSNCPPLIISGGSTSLVSQVGITPIDPSATSSFHAPSLWDSIRGNLIAPEDPRYGWVMLYRRNVITDQPTIPQTYVQVFVFPVETRNATQFDSTADTTLVSTNEANLMAHEVRVAIINDVAALGGTDLLALDTSSSVSAICRANVDAAAEGAYVVIANDQIASPANPAPGSDDRGIMNGRIYRLGARRAELDNSTSLFPGLTSSVIYELIPGNDFTPDPGWNQTLGPVGAREPDDVCAIGVDNYEGTTVTFNPAKPRATAYVIGRGFTQENLDAIRANPVAPALTAPLFGGPAMSIGAYTTYVKVSQ